LSSVASVLWGGNTCAGCVDRAFRTRWAHAVPVPCAPRLRAESWVRRRRRDRGRGLPGVFESEWSTVEHSQHNWTLEPESTDRSLHDLHDHILAASSLVVWERIGGLSPRLAGQGGVVRAGAGGRSFLLFRCPLVRARSQFNVAPRSKEREPQIKEEGASEGPPERQFLRPHAGPSRLGRHPTSSRRGGRVQSSAEGHGSHA
jgi:hypothetical protein